MAAMTSHANALYRITFHTVLIFTLRRKNSWVFTLPFHSVVKTYFRYRTGTNCYNVREYIHNNNTFIILLTKIVIELYVINIYCRYDSN